MYPCRRPCVGLSAGLGGAALGAAARLAALALQRCQEVHQRGLLVLGQVTEGWHRRRRVLERASQSALLQLVPDVAQMRAGPVIAVLADLVAGQATRLGGDELALLEVGRDDHVDRVRRT